MWCLWCFLFEEYYQGPYLFQSWHPHSSGRVLTNKPRSFSGVINVDIGSCDFHNFIGVASKMFAPVFVKRKVVYRSMKHFCDKSFQNDLDNVPFHVCNIFDDIDDICWAQNELFTSVLNEHAPLKVKCINKPQVPYINSELRKAMHSGNMWRGKNFRNKKDKYSRSMYVKWRNKVVRLRKISIQNYFDLRCNKKHNPSNPRDFYKIVSPFLSDKPSSSNGKIILCDDGNIISDSSQVANIFDMYYSSISEYDDIPDGLDCLTFEDIVLKHASHESISLIKQHTVLPRVRTFDLRLFHMRPSNATSTNWNPTKQLDLTDCRQNSWNCPV